MKTKGVMMKFVEIKKWILDFFEVKSILDLICTLILVMFGYNLLFIGESITVSFCVIVVVCFIRLLLRFRNRDKKINLTETIFTVYSLFFISLVIYFDFAEKSNRFTFWVALGIIPLLYQLKVHFEKKSE